MRENATYARVVDLLEQNGEMRARDVVVALDITSGKLSSALRIPIRDGLIVARRTAGSVHYSLGTGTPEADQAPQFRIARWSDGDIDLYGLTALEDGGHRLTRDQLQQLLDLIGPIQPATQPRAPG